MVCLSFDLDFKEYRWVSCLCTGAGVGLGSRNPITTRRMGKDLSLFILLFTFFLMVFGNLRCFGWDDTSVFSSYSISNLQLFIMIYFCPISSSNLFQNTESNFHINSSYLSTSSTFLRSITARDLKSTQSSQFQAKYLRSTQLQGTSSESSKLTT